MQLPVAPVRRTSDGARQSTFRCPFIHAAHLLSDIVRYKAAVSACDKTQQRGGPAARGQMLRKQSYDFILGLETCSARSSGVRSALAEGSRPFGYGIESLCSFRCHPRCAKAQQKHQAIILVPKQAFSVSPDVITDHALIFARAGPAMAPGARWIGAEASGSRVVGCHHLQRCQQCLRPRSAMVPTMIQTDCRQKRPRTQLLYLFVSVSINCARQLIQIKQPYGLSPRFDIDSTQEHRKARW